jgi:hypothetical protein
MMGNGQRLLGVEEDNIGSQGPKWTVMLEQKMKKEAEKAIRT